MQNILSSINEMPKLASNPMHSSCMMAISLMLIITAKTVSFVRMYV